MKVKELIKQLEGFNPDAEIKVKRQSEDIVVDGVYFIYKVKDDEGNEYSSENTYQVIMELDDICQSCQFFENRFCEVYNKPTEEVGECFQYQQL